MKMTQDVINARKLRLSVITNLFKKGELTDFAAKEILAGNLEPDNQDTFVDDSALLGDPDGLNKIEAEMEQKQSQLSICFERLYEYCKHNDGCPTLISRNLDECNCGLFDATSDLAGEINRAIEVERHINDLPVANLYYADVYKTDDTKIIHLWKNGKSFDVILPSEKE